MPGRVSVIFQFCIGQVSHQHQKDSYNTIQCLTVLTTRFLPKNGMSESKFMCMQLYFCNFLFYLIISSYFFGINFFFISSDVLLRGIMEKMKKCLFHASLNLLGPALPQNV